MIGVDERELLPETVEALRQSHIDAATRRIKGSALLLLFGLASGAAFAASAYADGRRRFLSVYQFWTSLLVATAAFVALIAAVRDRARIIAAVRAAAPLGSPDYELSAQAVTPHTHWLYKSAIALGILLLIPLGYYTWRGAKNPIAAPLVLRYATIVSGTGYENRRVDILVDLHGVVAVAEQGGHPLRVPRDVPEFDASSQYVAAAVFDRTVADPLAGLRHIWLGQVEPGAPGDLIVLSISPARLRPGGPVDPNVVVGAVVDGRYYSGTDLRARHKGF